jgi:outer membrane receptor protein involved in Fe transport
MGGERVELKDPDFGPDFPGRELRSHRATASINAILAKQFGVFLRYAYTEAEGTGGLFDGQSVPGIPDHIANGGVVWISPLFMKVVLSETYVGEQFADYSNEDKVSHFWTTDLSATWEPFQKHGLVALSVSNLFNAGDPAPGRYAYITLEYRF